MNEYQALLSDLGFARAANISAAPMQALFGGYEAPPEWYGFPPALIPIVSDGSLPLYVGLWKHWFLPRTPSFVEVSVSDDYRTEEIARTEDQLTQLMVARLIVHRDGIDDEVRAFAADLDVENLDEIDAFTDLSGDDLSAYAALPAFSNRTPRIASQDGDYSGEFPFAGQYDADRQAFFEFEDLPPAAEALWLDPVSDKAAAFDHFMAQSEFAKAWLTINGTGWSFADAALAITELSRAPSADPLFRRMAEIWSQHASQESGGY
ncbi:hypothetical protein JJJ17_17345 [Paracoccus caeni]|uniref:Uncharacterized protein n=1 Tax=Paracoccus caeni TaxID=657651 RepID=A0A934SF39_9RHOB|nr:hypothetical protein [Paracoccus caeni]MBK4217700.1 hypothetical protein [Paracoccus caeni]